MTEYYRNTTEPWLIENWISVRDMAPYNIFLGLVTLVCTLLGTPGNILAVTYFWSHTHKRVSTHLYALLCSANSCICAMSLAVALSGLTNNSSMLFKYQAFCTIWGVAWSTVDRMVIFILLVFSTTRIVSLHFPFIQISNCKVLLPMIVYFILSLLQGLIPVMTQTKFQHIPYHTSSCIYDMTEIFPLGSTGYNIMVGFIVLVQFDLLICTMIVIIGRAAWLIKDRYRLQPSPHRHSREAACRTMILITGTYVLFNLPYCIYYTLHFVETVADVRIIKLTLTSKRTDIFIKFVYEIITLHAIVITSTVEMCVLYSRNPHLRRYARAALRCWRHPHKEQRQPDSRGTLSTQFNSKNVSPMELVDIKRWKSAIFRPILPDPTIPESRSAPNLKLECSVMTSSRQRSNSDDLTLRVADLNIVDMS